MDPYTASTLYAINTGVAGAIDSGAIAGLDAKSRLTATGAYVGGVILAIGVVVMVVSMTNQNDGAVIGFMIAIAGMFIAVM